MSDYTYAYADISGIDKVELMTELWKNAVYDPVFDFFPDKKPTLDKNEIVRILTDKNPQRAIYFRDLCGKPLYVSLNHDLVLTSDYDARMGAGAFRRVVDMLRRKE